MFNRDLVRRLEPLQRHGSFCRNNQVHEDSLQRGDAGDAMGDHASDARGDDELDNVRHFFLFPFFFVFCLFEALVCFVFVCTFSRSSKWIEKKFQRAVIVFPLSKQ